MREYISISPLGPLSSAPSAGRVSGAHTLDQLGFLPFDLVNFPGRVAATIFTVGCPLRCPYCHNPDLVGPPGRGGRGGRAGAPSDEGVQGSMVASPEAHGAKPGQRAQASAEGPASLTLTPARTATASRDKEASPPPVPPTPRPHEGRWARGAVLDHLARRRGLLGGVVLSGGEPCMHPGLGTLVDQIAALGYPLKVDTSGVYPQALASLLARPTIHRVALDLKAAPEHYHRLGWAGAGRRLIQSLDLLAAWLASSPHHALDLRTTTAPGITEAADLAAIDALVARLTAAALSPHQVTYTRHPFVPGQCLDPDWEARAGGAGQLQSLLNS